jgi:hypothetical protein
MGDSTGTSESLQLLHRRQDELYARELLDSYYLDLDDHTVAWILNHIDCFV